jgi:MFS family permease
MINTTNREFTISEYASPGTIARLMEMTLLQFKQSIQNANFQAKSEHGSAGIIQSSPSTIIVTTSPSMTTTTSTTSTTTQRERRWALILFSITTVLLFADQNLMSPNLTAIADDFGLDSEERDRKLGGDISLAFFLLGAPASLLVGFLADTMNRAKVFGWTVAIGEVACFATFFVETYTQLYICRAITGFSVGGAFPVIYSVLGDLFAAEDRHVVSAMVSSGVGAGISVGQAMAGYLGPTFGWRLPFLVISIPALFCAGLVYCTVKDPERGVMEPAFLESRDADDEGGIALVATSNIANFQSAKDGEPILQVTTIPVHFSGKDSSSGWDPRKSCRNGSSSGTLRNTSEQFDSMLSDPYGTFFSKDWALHFRSTYTLLSTPTVVLSLMQGAPGCIPWGIINVFLNDYLSEDRGFTVEAATTILMLFSLGYGLGLMVGGIGGRGLYQIDVRLPALLAGGTAIIGCFPLWYLMNHVDASTPYYISALCATIAGLGSAPAGPIIKATLTNVTLPRARGQAFALFNLFDDFGKGLGPFYVSLLIVHFGGRLRAFNLGVFGWILCGVFNFAIFFTVARDERTVQMTLKAAMYSVSSLP